MSFTHSKLSGDEAIFYAIVPAADRRHADRVRAGTPATATRLIGGAESGSFQVMVTDASERGVGIRCGVPLERGASYRLRMLAGQAADVRVVRSRLRHDGLYDVGALRESISGRGARPAA